MLLGWTGCSCLPGNATAPDQADRLLELVAVVDGRLFMGRNVHLTAVDFASDCAHSRPILLQKQRLRLLFDYDCAMSKLAYVMMCMGACMCVI